MVLFSLPCRAAGGRGRRIPLLFGRERAICSPGNDLTYRFSLIVESIARLRLRSCITVGPHLRAVLSRDDPKSAVLYFMQPQRPRGRLLGFCGQARRDKPDPGYASFNTKA
jgi:hypothetical protein